MAFGSIDLPTVSGRFQDSLASESISGESALEAGWVSTQSFSYTPLTEVITIDP
jgi:hypothetical protein